MPEKQEHGRHGELDRVGDVDDFDVRPWARILVQRRTGLRRRRSRTMRPERPWRFKDHFSRQSAAYSRYRPSYPPELIDYVASQAPRRGARRRLRDRQRPGGARARGALRRGRSPSTGACSQLARARPHARVSRTRRPWPSGCRSRDRQRRSRRRRAGGALVRLRAFPRRVPPRAGAGRRRRRCGPTRMFRVGAAVDAVIDDFYERRRSARDWPPERRYVEQGYRTLPFPWREETAPEFELDTDWDLEQVMGYLATLVRGAALPGSHGARPARGTAATARPRWWPRSGAMRLRWPLHLRLGPGLIHYTSRPSGRSASGRRAVTYDGDAPMMRWSFPVACLLTLTACAGRRRSRPSPSPAPSRGRAGGRVAPLGRRSSPTSTRACARRTTSTAT